MTLTPDSFTLFDLVTSFQEFKEWKTAFTTNISSQYFDRCHFWDQQLIFSGRHFSLRLYAYHLETFSAEHFSEHREARKKSLLLTMAPCTSFPIWLGIFWSSSQQASRSLWLKTSIIIVTSVGCLQMCAHWRRRCKFRRRKKNLQNTDERLFTSLLSYIKLWWKSNNIFMVFSASFFLYSYIFFLNSNITWREIIIFLHMTWYIVWLRNLLFSASLTWCGVKALDGHQRRATGWAQGEMPVGNCLGATRSWLTAYSWLHSYSLAWLLQRYYADFWT